MDKIKFDEKKEELFAALGISPERAMEIVKSMKPMEIKNPEELPKLLMDLISQALNRNDLTDAEMLWFAFHVGEGLGQIAVRLDMEFQQRMMAKAVRGLIDKHGGIEALKAKAGAGGLMVMGGGDGEDGEMPMNIPPAEGDNDKKKRGAKSASPTDNYIQ
jgi:hypothetical protein